MNTRNSGFAPDFSVDWHSFHAAIWRDISQRLKPIRKPDCQPIDRLLGMEKQKKQLLDNTALFVAGKSAHHALLWGARGCGKSSLIGALLPLFADQGLRMVQLSAQGLYMLEELVDHLRELPWRFIVHCDDLCFTSKDANLLGLKVLLEGSLEPIPENLLLYASSNHRHLMPESANSLARTGEQGTLHHGDNVESTLSLADRFGLWLSFYSCNQDEYLAIVADQLAAAHLLDTHHNWQESAMRFARQRGVFSGRTARHFVHHFRQQKF